MKKCQNKKQIFGAIMVALAIVGSATLGVFARDLTNDEKTYSTDIFSPLYSQGFLNLSNNTTASAYFSGQHMYLTQDSGVPISNTAKDESVYINLYFAAASFGENLDVRIYPWITSSAEGVFFGLDKTNGRIEVASTESDSYGVKLEFHFYKGGTLTTASPEEVDFKGVMLFRDIKKTDSWDIQNYNNVFVASNTILSHSEGTHLWSSANDCSTSNNNCAIWAEIQSSASSPLIATYSTSTNGHLARIANPDTQTVSYDVKYKPSEGADAQTAEVNSSEVIKYGSIIPGVRLDDNNGSYVSKDWYSNSALTTKVEPPVAVTKNITLYTMLEPYSPGPSAPSEGDDDPPEITPDGPINDDPDPNGQTNNQNDSSSTDKPTSGDEPNTGAGTNNTDTNTNTNTNTNNNANTDTDTDNGNSDSTGKTSNSSNNESGSNYPSSTGDNSSDNINTDDTTNLNLNNGECAWCAAAAQHTDKSNDIAVPYTSSYTPNSATTSTSATNTVYYPNTGRVTNVEKSENENILINILRLALLAIGIAGVAQIIFTYRRKLHF